MGQANLIKYLLFFFSLPIVIFGLLVGCQPSEKPDNENGTSRSTIKENHIPQQLRGSYEKVSNAYDEFKVTLANFNKELKEYVKAETKDTNKIDFQNPSKKIENLFTAWKNFKAEVEKSNHQRQADISKDLINHIDSNIQYISKIINPLNELKKAEVEKVQKHLDFLKKKIYQRSIMVNLEIKLRKRSRKF